MRNSLKLARAAFGAALCIITPSAVSALTYDFEDLDVGDLAGQGGWTVAPQENRTATVVEGGLAFGNGTFSFIGGEQHLRLEMPPTGETPQPDPISDFVSISFDPLTGGDDDTVYFRILFNADVAAWSFLNFGFSGTDISRVSAASIALRSPPQFRAWNAGGAQDNADAGTFEAETTYLLMGRVTLNADGPETIDYAINPSSDDEAAIAWTTINRELGVTSIRHFGVFPNGNDNRVLHLDEIMVADTFAELVAGGDPVVASGVTLEPETLELPAGTSERLIATVGPRGADNTVTWSTSDEAVATVDANGEVTAVAEGSATITATTVSGGFTASTEVTVTEGAASTLWAGYTKTDGWVFTGDLFFGWLYVEEDPWIYSYSLGDWVYLLSEDLNVNGVWAYFLSYGSVAQEEYAPWVLAEGLDAWIYAPDYTTADAGGWAFVFNSHAMKQVAILIDDGPHTGNAPQYIQLFAQEGIVANFAHIGNNVAQSPQVTRALSDAGHQILNHSMTHGHFRDMDDATLRDEILAPLPLYQEALGYTPSHYWPAFGERDPRMYTLLEEGNMILFLQSEVRFVDSGDWDTTVPRATLLERALRGIDDPAHDIDGDRAVVLFHEWRGDSVANMPEVIAAYRERGYRFVTIAEILEDASVE